MFSSEKLSVPVVSVGNVVVGGTGKTPLVHLLAGALQNKVRLAILTRGFRSKMEKSGAVKQISAGSGPLFPAEECGDEPFFLAQKTKACVWVGANRVLSGRSAIAQGANCLLLDDGMQHRRLKRDFEIAIIDGANPFSQGRFLPWGLLRDSPKRLKNAHLIVATHVVDLAHFQQLQSLISQFSSAPVVGAQIEVFNRHAFLPRKVGVFCGIGQPARFLQTARDLNQEIVDTLILKDHGSLQPGQLEKFAENCLRKGAKVLLCTEKDAVKLCDNGLRALNIVPIEIELKIIAGNAHWEHLIDNILDKVAK
jgi:tetraacyldisaccharide 4'-kinase